MQRRWTSIAAGAVTSAEPGPAATNSAGRESVVTRTSRRPPKHVEVLFVGAHPDDESGLIATLGQWHEQFGITSAIVTLTRGEGGGNCVGPEEGPALGLLREHEERACLELAHVEEIFHLDKVDYYYTVSAGLTAQIWGRDDTLARLVRIIRQIRPAVVITMNPAPVPGQHGHHQLAGRLATEAYRLAGQPTAFPEQINLEGLAPFAPSRLLVNTFDGDPMEAPLTPARLHPSMADETIYSVWGGAVSATGDTWAQVQRESQRRFVSQGWASFPDAPTDPSQIGWTCLTQVASRVPFPEMGTRQAERVDAALAGALTRPPGTTPLGTGLELDLPARVLPQTSMTAHLVVSAPPDTSLTGICAQVVACEGWTVPQPVTIADLAPGQQATVALTLTSPATAATPSPHVIPCPQRRPPRQIRLAQRVAVRLTTDQGSAHTCAVTAVVPEVVAHQQHLPQVREYEAWVEHHAFAHMSGLVTPVATVPRGGSRTLAVVVTNNAAGPRSGTVTLDLPAGFENRTGTRQYLDLPAGGSTVVEFTVANTDQALETGKYGGDYRYRILTQCQSGLAVIDQYLELVPATVVPRAERAPDIDGIRDPLVYRGEPIDISRQWEGALPASPPECSGQAWAAWHGETLYVFASVHDSLTGSVLSRNDCKRHWRTDSLEINIDPSGASENTSTTFKAAIIPRTKEGGPYALRDADHHQGDAATTAPGMRWAVRRTASGYDYEVGIPISCLPGKINPKDFGLNILYYHSASPDRVGRTRIGWSVWGGVQGDPYRWGRARLESYGSRLWPEVNQVEPVMPLEALLSWHSPQAIEQAVRTGVPLAGLPGLCEGEAGLIDFAKAGRGRVVVGLVAAAPGSAHVHVVDDDGIVGSACIDLPQAGRRRVKIGLTRDLVSSARVLLGWVSPDPSRGTLSSVRALPPSSRPLAGVARVMTAAPASPRRRTRR